MIKKNTYLVRSQSTYHSPLEVRVCGTTATTGLLDGHFVGLFDGTFVGFLVGLFEGCSVVGLFVGLAEGDRVGMAVVGAIVG